MANMHLNKLSSAEGNQTNFSAETTCMQNRDNLLMLISALKKGGVFFSNNGKFSALKRCVCSIGDMRYVTFRAESIFQGIMVILFSALNETSKIYL